MHTLEGVEIIVLWKMLVVDCFFPGTEETQFSKSANVAASMEGRSQQFRRVEEMAGNGQAGTEPLMQCTQCCQASFSSENCCVLYN
jgi:hypothetical protein